MSEVDKHNCQPSVVAPFHSFMLYARLDWCLFLNHFCVVLGFADAVGSLVIILNNNNNNKNNNKNQFFSQLQSNTRSHNYSGITIVDQT